MRIASWNINGVRARIEYIQKWLEARSPDIVGFQELKALDEVFPHEPFNELGYAVHTHGQKGWNGVAIASKEPVNIVQKGLNGQEPNGARLITCESDGLTYVTVYCPNGKNLEHADYEMKLDWFGSLAIYCKQLVSTGQEVLIGGDYNICVAAIDSHLGEDGDAEIFHTAREREVMQQFFEVGLIDLYRHQYRTLMLILGGTLGAVHFKRIWGFASTSCLVQLVWYNGLKTLLLTEIFARRLMV